jgi:P pilus assembly chaperone PapD
MNKGKSMFFNIKRCALLSVILFASLVSQAYANLLISPTRVMLDDRQRSAKVNLINPTNETRTYRLEWLNKKVNQFGGYEALTEAELANFPKASDMLRLSPKQVTLGPNERQTIKVVVRRPKDLADGEYRSHLAFTALPKKKSKEGDEPSQGASFQVDVLLSFDIPVIVRQGKLDADIKVLAAELTHHPENSAVDIVFDVARTGNSSVTGNFMVYWQPKGSSSETLVTRVHGYNLYTEHNNYKVKLAWADFKPSAGTLRIVYEGKKEFSGQILADQVLKIAKKDIKTFIPAPAQPTVLK